MDTTEANPARDNDTHWRTLKPLVRQGQNRKLVIDELVAAFIAAATDSSKNPALEDIEFVDESQSTREPVDFGDILREVVARLGQLDTLASARVALTHCSIEVCEAAGLDLSRVSLLLSGCRFSGLATFSRTTFAPGRTLFEFVKFKEPASFDKATLDRVQFHICEFLDEALFERASFGVESSFYRCYFGRWTSFVRCSSEASMRIDHCSFGELVDFSFARFGPFTQLSDCLFRDDVCFQSAYFEAGATLRRTAFRGRVVALDLRFKRPGGLGEVQVCSPYPSEPPDCEGKFVLSEARATDLSRRAWQLGALFTRIWSHVALWFDWERVRHVGELRALTRISYTWLVVTPLIAACWPGLRYVIHQTKDAMARAATDLDRAAEALERAAAAANVDSQGLSSIVAEAESHAHTVVSRMHAASGPDPALPLDFVILFFGALAIAMGHLVYQLGAPQLIRERSRDDIIKERAAAFRDGKDHERNDLVQRALEKLRLAAKELPWVRHPNFVRRHGEAVWVPWSFDEFQEFERLPAQDRKERAELNEYEAMQGEPPENQSDTLPKPTLSHTPDEMRLLLIDEGATAEYDVAARLNMPWACVACTFYLVGFYLVFWLVSDQASFILREADVHTPVFPDWRREGLWTLLGLAAGSALLGLVSWWIERKQRQAFAA